MTGDETLSSIPDQYLWMVFLDLKKVLGFCFSADHRTYKRRTTRELSESEVKMSQSSFLQRWFLSFVGSSYHNWLAQDDVSRTRWQRSYPDILAFVQ